jgi:hypothetical protein
MTSDERILAQLDASNGAFEFCDTSEGIISTSSTAAGIIPGLEAAVTTASKDVDGNEIETEPANVPN